MKRTFITAIAAMMLCIPAAADSWAEVEPSAAEKKEKVKKEVKYNEAGEIIKTGINLSLNIVVLKAFIAPPTSPATPFMIESPPTNFLKNNPMAEYITISITCIIINKLFEITLAKK